jgi:hypothetical protein
VKSGHYVRVKPDPLPLPQLVVHSAAMADALGLSEAEVATERFAKFFSGDMAQVRLLPSPRIPRSIHLPTMLPGLLRLPGNRFGIAGFDAVRFVAACGDAGARTGVVGDAVRAFDHGQGAVPQLSVRQWQRLWRWARHLCWRGKRTPNRIHLSHPPPPPLPAMYLRWLPHARVSASMHRIRSCARVCAVIDADISPWEKVTRLIT